VVFTLFHPLPRYKPLTLPSRGSIATVRNFFAKPLENWAKAIDLFLLETYGWFYEKMPTLNPTAAFATI
jgi:hypothetical protein